MKLVEGTGVASVMGDGLLLWRQARRAGHADVVGKETEEAEELLLLNKPLAQFISPLTHLVNTDVMTDVVCK